MRPSQKDKIYEYLAEFYRQNGYSPSMGQIAAALGLSSRSNINRQLLQLVDDGRLAHVGGKFYPNDTAQERNIIMVPILGNIAAGIPNYGY